MSKDFEQWKEILSSLEKHKDSFLKTIRSILRKGHKKWYNIWKGSKFDLNHLFSIFITKNDNKKIHKLTLLHLATYHNKLTLVEKLLEKGANPNVLSSKKQTALHISVEKNNAEMVEVLIKAGASVNAQNTDENTALHIAAKQNNANMIEVLIKAGANVNAQNTDGNTTLHLAVEQSNAKMAAILIKAGANVNVQNTYGKTPLNLSTENSFMNDFINLLTSKDHITLDDNNSQIWVHTLLTHALKGLLNITSPEKFNILIDCLLKYKVNVKDYAAHIVARAMRMDENNIRTKLMLAERNFIDFNELVGEDNICEKIWKLAGIDSIDFNEFVEDFYGGPSQGILHVVTNYTGKNSCKILEKLLKYKNIDVNVRKDFCYIGRGGLETHNAPLHIAIKNANLTKVALLLNHEEIDINLQIYERGYFCTPLELAVSLYLDDIRTKYSNIMINIIKLLLNHQNIIVDPSQCLALFAIYDSSYNASFLEKILPHFTVYLYEEHILSAISKHFFSSLSFVPPEHDSVADNRSILNFFDIRRPIYTFYNGPRRSCIMDNEGIPISYILDKNGTLELYDVSQEDKQFIQRMLNLAKFWIRYCTIIMGPNSKEHVSKSLNESHVATSVTKVLLKSLDEFLEEGKEIVCAGLTLHEICKIALNPDMSSCVLSRKQLIDLDKLLATITTLDCFDDFTGTKLENLKKPENILLIHKILEHHLPTNIIKKKTISDFNVSMQHVINNQNHINIPYLVSIITGHLPYIITNRDAKNASFKIKIYLTNYVKDACSIIYHHLTRNNEPKTRDSLIELISRDLVHLQDYIPVRDVSEVINRHLPSEFTNKDVQDAFFSKIESDLMKYMQNIYSIIDQHLTHYNKMKIRYSTNVIAAITADLNYMNELRNKNYLHVCDKIAQYLTLEDAKNFNTAITFEGRIRSENQIRRELATSTTNTEKLKINLEKTTTELTHLFAQKDTEISSLNKQISKQKSALTLLEDEISTLKQNLQQKAANTTNLKYKLKKLAKNKKTYKICSVAFSCLSCAILSVSVIQIIASKNHSTYLQAFQFTIIFLSISLLMILGLACTFGICDNIDEADSIIVPTISEPTTTIGADGKPDPVILLTTPIMNVTSTESQCNDSFNHAQTA